MRGLLVIGPVVGLLATSAPAAAQSIVDAVDGLRPSHNRMVGSDPAAADAWPWQVLIQIPLISKTDAKKKGNGTCGGSLIGERWVLTAAHCFGEDDWDFDKSRQVGVIERLGAAKGKAIVDIDPKSVHWIGTPIVHRQYHDKSHENDIALLHLSEASQARAVPILLAPNRALENPPARTVVTGWGYQREGSGVLSDRLRQAELPLVATDQCKTDNSGQQGAVIDGRTLCAGFPEGRVDSCQGDSGGPMMIHTSRDRWVQIGVVSWGDGCARPNRPGIYTRVSAFADWIRSNVGRDLAIAADNPDEKPQPIDQEKPNPRPSPPTNPQVDNVAGLAIAFDKGDNVKVDDIVAYRVTTRQPGYLAIFDATPDGKLTQIFPNARSMMSPTGAKPDAGLVRPDRPRLIPDARNPYEGFKLKVAEPRGKGTMVAVLSDTPITSLDTPQGPKTFATPEEAIAALSRLRGELSRDVRPEAKPNWSIDVHEYKVR
jgi:secreted trypsin-like serine protease